MKKILFTAAALALLTGMASCTSDEPGVPSGDGNVTFRVSLPADMATRDYSDGLTATKLHYYVYDEDNGSANLPALNGTATFVGRETDISLSLASGKSYSIVFWADAPGNTAYKYDITSKEITVTYGGAAQDESRDAFTAYESTFKVSGPINKPITLRRPLAQINVGTSDKKEAADAGNAVKQTGMKVKGVYNKLNLATGAVDVDGDGEVTFASSAIPGDGENFPVGGYDYLAMNYVLVASDKATVDVTLTTDCAQNPEVTFSQVPVQRNYRTNIYGALLTNPTLWNVIIDQEYAGDDIDLNKDQELHDGVYFNETSKEYKVSSADGFKWFAENVTLKGNETFRLINDIDFKGEVVTPIKVAFEPEKKITFDGQGHTVKNLILENDKSSLIAGTMVGTLKNLNVEGVSGSVTTRFVGLVKNMYGNIENVHVKNVNIQGTDGRVGAIVGIHNSGNMTDCSAENVTINAGWSVGGVSGAINETANRKYKNVTVKDITVGTDAAWGGNAPYKGAITGDIYVRGVVFEDCRIEGTITGCESPELPIDVPDFDYIWNGTTIKAAE